MTTATLHFGVTDLAYEKAHDVEVASKPRLPWALAEKVVQALGSYVAGVVERRAKEFAEWAVWFNGAVVTLGNERVNGHVDLNDKLVPYLESIESQLLVCREHALKAVASIESKGKSTRLSRAMRALARSSADLYEAIVAFKWAVMENDAEVDISHGNFEVFDNPDALIARLHQA